jgi:hypothetical protein
MEGKTITCMKAVQINNLNTGHADNTKKAVTKFLMHNNRVNKIMGNNTK